MGPGLHRPERSPDFTSTLAAFRQYKTVRNVWTREGLMEWNGGKRHGQTFDGTHIPVTGKAAGWAPRLRATGKLLEIALRHGVSPGTLRDHFERAHDFSDPVVLRKRLDLDNRGDGRTKASEVVRFERTGAALRIGGEVRALNGFLAAQTYDPPMTPRLVCLLICAES